MAKRKIEPNALTLSPFAKWSEDWALVTVSDREKVNTMTVAWGGLGVLWSKNVVTVYVHPDRYTHAFLEKADKFSVTFFKDQRRALTFLGTVSGRDRDKIRESGLTLEWLDGAPVFAEASLTVTCSLLYREPLDRAHFLSPEIGAACWGRSDELHSIYIGEVLGVYTDD